MELKTFVTETLKEIIEGVEDAQEYFGTKNVIISPRKIDGGQDMQYTRTMSGDIRPAQHIDFEVSLGQVEGTEAKGGIGVIFAALGGGIQGKTETESSALNKVRFSIPVSLPFKG